MRKYYFFESEADERDYIYGNMTFLETKGTLPSKFRLQCAPIKDQKFLGSCVGMALASIMECDTMVRFDQAEILSPLFIYAKAKAKDGHKGQGTQPRVGLEQLKANGVCKESLYPYIDNLDTRNNIFPAITSDVVADAKLRKPTGYAQITNIKDLKRAVYEENGAMICVKIYSNFEDTYRGFLLPPKGTYSGNHALAVVGYDDDLEMVLEGKTYKGFLILKDSYGNDPGRDNGYFYLAYDGLDWKATIYSVDRLVNEIWTTFDTSKVKNANFHIDKFDGEGIHPMKEVIVLQLGSNKAYINGKEKILPTPPTMRNNITFLPIRFVTENFSNTRISYQNETKEIFIYESNLKLNIIMQVGNKVATVDGKDYHMIEAPFIENGSTLVPIRAVSDMLGYKVDFDNVSKKITITS